METSSFLSSEETQYLLRCWVETRGLVAHQIESYDAFLAQRLQEIVSEGSTVHVTSEKTGASLTVELQKLCVRLPTFREPDGSSHLVTPQECRARALDYNVAVHVDALQTTRAANGIVKKTVYGEVLLCRLPCMVRSGFCTTQLDGSRECPLDPGGYFLVGGNEKAVVAQEKLRTNYVFVKRTSPQSCCAEVRSLHATKTRSTSTLFVNLNARAGQRGEAMTASLPFIDAAVPLAVVFKLLGYGTAAEIAALLASHSPEDAPAELPELLARSLDTGLLLEDRQALVDHIGREGVKDATAQLRGRYVEHIVANELLPHQGLEATPATAARKAAFLAVVAVKLARVHLGDLPPDDRDDFALKRVEATGGLLALLFRQFFRQLLKDVAKAARRALDADRPFNASDALSSRRITVGVRSAMSTGCWGVQKQSSQNGVAQLLTRMNYLATLSHLRRVSTPVNRDGKQPAPRELSTSHYGILCPVETPEGAACGLVENLALLAHVRVGSAAEPVVALLRREGFLTETPRQGLWHVCVNGCLEGFVEDGLALCERLRALRRRCALPFDATVAARPRERLVFVDVDAGCLLRPLLRLESLVELRRLLLCTPPHALWSELLAAGCVELVDKLEERSLVLGGTHAELHPAASLGLCAGLIPFCNHNQAPRNIYESAMAKQAMGSATSRPESRTDAVSHVLHSPQEPLVQTLLHSATSCDRMPAGVNVVVAVLAYTGFNQEDSIIVNRSALERGLFRSSVFKSFKDEEKRSGADSEHFGPVPANAVGARKANYGKVEEDGLPALDAAVNSGDVIICKRLVATQLGVDKKKRASVVDHSTVLAASEPMRVDAVFFTTNKDGGRLTRVRLRAGRTPVIGDKFSSHHGQKGVIGMTLAAEDMPFTADGVVPDLVVNPHGLPSRMTVGQLLEMLLGKVCALRGRSGDGTPFSDVKPSAVCDELGRLGFESRGNEIFFNGVTGEPLETTVYVRSREKLEGEKEQREKRERERERERKSPLLYVEVGPCHYARLRHCVVEKMHARSRGPMQLLSRQPVEGRSRGGGLRVGEMERDCILSHGASAVLLDRLFHQSDEFHCAVCRRCGLVAESLSPDAAVQIEPRDFCRGCGLGGADHVARVALPYSRGLGL